MKRFSFLFLTFLLSQTLISSPYLFSQSKDGANGDLKIQEKSVFKPNSQRKGCCKIKLPGGGYDFVILTEDECKNSQFYDRYLGEGNSLCMEWKE